MRRLLKALREQLRLSAWIADDPNPEPYLTPEQWAKVREHYGSKSLKSLHTRVDFLSGDRFAYKSVTQGYLVIFTRGEDGLWWASDEDTTKRGPALDEHIRHEMTGDDYVYARGDVLDALLDFVYGRQPLH